MIRYALQCANNHKFEGWFANSDAFDTQNAEQGIACPACGAVEIEKALMAPAVASRGRGGLPVAAHVTSEAEMVSLLRKLRKHVTETADYVGDRFAEEARRIHYQEVEQRGIYGEANSDEVRSLVEEGIEFHPLPILPEDHN